MRTSLPILLALAGAFAPALTPAVAEVQKHMSPCGEQKLCASYTVTLAPPDGWTIDAAASAERGVQILVPKGKSFDTAAAVIYVQVVYQPDKALSLADFARDSNTRWAARLPGSTTTPRPPVARTGGQPAFLVFAYNNPGTQGQASELGAFALDRDGDGNAFVVNVVVSGADKAAVDAAEPVFVALLKRL